MPPQPICERRPTDNQPVQESLNNNLPENHQGTGFGGKPHCNPVSTVTFFLEDSLVQLGDMKSLESHIKVFTPLAHGYVVAQGDESIL